MIGGENAVVLYANMLNISGQPWDVTLDLGYRTPAQADEFSTRAKIAMAQGQDATSEANHVARVAMSYAFAKLLMSHLSRIIVAYEADHGIIITPGFEED